MGSGSPCLGTKVAHLIGPGKVRLINDRLAFSNGKAAALRLDLGTLRLVVCHGPVGWTDRALARLFPTGVEVAFLSRAGGRYHGRVAGSHLEGTWLRTQQHRAASEPKLALEVARGIVTAKIESQVDGARRLQRKGLHSATDARRGLGRLLDAVRRADDRNELRGLEGRASAIWFRLFAAALIKPWDFPARSIRPPRDPVNALLSLGYTWLLARVGARSQAFGFELNVGFLHEYRPGRPSLACDVMEPLRLPMVDRWVLAICNRKELRPDAFVREGEGVRLSRALMPRLVTSWEQHASRNELDAVLDEGLSRLASWLRQNDQ